MRSLKSCDVLLVSMPFGPLLQPSLGLSLLKAGLTPHGISARVRYYTLAFAKLVGVPSYLQVTHGPLSATDLIGEWIFAGALFPPDRRAVRQYTAEVLLARTGADGLPRAPASRTLWRRVARMRRLAPLFLKQCLCDVQTYHARLVGFSSVFEQQIASLALARSIKARRPETFIVFGGANCESVMGVELVRQFPFVDAVVSGEGDLVFPELAARVLKGSSTDALPGVYTRRNLPVLRANPHPPNAPMVRDMDALPYPEYDDYYRQYRAARLRTGYSPTLLLETSRGCWWGERMHCTFCGLNGATMTYRSKSAERALAEVIHLTRKYREPVVTVVDNILDMNYLKDFIPQLAERKLSLDLFYEVKANLKKEQLRLLRAAGVTTIQPGIESFSTPVLKLMRKGVTGLQNIQLLKWCAELGFKPLWNILWGFPGEPAEEYARMARIIPLLTHLTPPLDGGRIRLDRFSPNFDCADELGFANVAVPPAYRFIYPLPDDAIARLAYYFVFDYRTPQNVAQYTRPVFDAITTWRALHGRSAFRLVDRGSELVLEDGRPIARQKKTVLQGLERAVYLACDAARPLFELRSRLERDAGVSPTEEELQTLLDGFVERSLMLREGGYYLSLAVPRQRST